MNEPNTGDAVTVPAAPAAPVPAATPAAPTVEQLQAELAEAQRKADGLQAGIAEERRKRQLAERTFTPDPEPPAAPAVAPRGPAPQPNVVDIGQTVEQVLEQREARAAAAETQRAFQERRAVAEAAMPDFDMDAAYQNVGQNITEDVARAIVASPRSWEIIAHLDQNPAKLQALYTDPTVALPMLGEIAAGLAVPGSDPSAPPIPPPINPVGGSPPVVDKNPDDMSMSEYEAWARKRRGGTVWP